VAPTPFIQLQQLTKQGGHTGGRQQVRHTLCCISSKMKLPLTPQINFVDLANQLTYREMLSRGGASLQTAAQGANPWTPAALMCA